MSESIFFLIIVGVLYIAGFVMMGFFTKSRPKAILSLYQYRKPMREMIIFDDVSFCTEEIKHAKTQ